VGWHPSTLGSLLAGGWYGILQSAGLLFFAFAGYARTRNMGEEVRDPERTIPLAILIALSIAVLIYLTVGVSILVGIGPAGVADTPAPLAAAVQASGWAWASMVVRLGAAAAALGALLALIAGIGRTTLAMARHDDLPRWLAAVPRTSSGAPSCRGCGHRVVCVLILFTDLRGVIGFSSFGVCCTT
jgi:APA family basic amino acid/polyamine antiporter